jgi:hypothetical protein
MRKLLITLALAAGPAVLAAQQPTQTPAKPATTQDSTKVKPKARTTAHVAATTRRHRATARAAHDTTKAKVKTTPPAQDSTKDPT